MEEKQRTTELTSNHGPDMALLYRHWIGLRSSNGALECALLTAVDTCLDQVTVPNDRRSMIKVIKHWVKHHKLEPRRAWFCMEEGDRRTGTVLQFIIERGWPLRYTNAQRLLEDLELEGGGAIDAEHIARHVQRFPERTMEPGPAMLNDERVRQLRSRREQFLRMRTECLQRSGEQDRHLESELQREFERMERRHLQLLDRFLHRLDTLIAIQVTDGSGSVGGRN